ncbi:MAG: signal peptidase I [Clostridia bacterium]|nr:signal peptidase I [Clostridia bacterium]
MREEKKQREKGALAHKIWTVAGFVLCAVFLPILILNCILMVKGAANEDEVPSIGGVSPLIVLTDSMYPEIKSGDLIFSKKTDAASVEIGDVISFFDPSGNGSSVVTHRVIDIAVEEDGYYFQTQGDNNNIPDRKWVSETELVGVWTEVRLAGVGNVAMFMQSTAGLLICICVPLAALIAYDLVRRKKLDKSKQTDMEALVKELNELKAATAQANAETIADETVPETEETE